jgi:large subunit ribosomal protein L15
MNKDKITNMEKKNVGNFLRKPKANYRKDTTNMELSVIEEGNILKYMPRVPGKDKTRKGRGTGSGHGNMCTRGSKGQGRSSGMAGAKPGFEGGQTPWYKRIPKRGFQPYEKYETLAVRLNRLIEEMEKKKLSSAKIEDILNIFDAPFYYKKIRIFGEVDKIPMVIDVECNSISQGAKISIANNKGSYQEIRNKSHSARKTTYNQEAAI